MFSFAVHFIFHLRKTQFGFVYLYTTIRRQSEYYSLNRTTLNSYKKKLHTQSLCKLFQKVFFRGFLLASFFHFTSFIIIMITNIAYIAFKVLCCPHNFTFSYCSISTEFTQRFSLYFSFIISFLFSSYLFFYIFSRSYAFFLPVGFLLAEHNVL